MKHIFNPDYYHGAKKTKNFFEGWYYKIVDKEGQNSFAFIPGIIKGKFNEDGHSFIQVIDGKNKKSYYIKFTKDNFKAKKNEFNIEIGNNRFALKEIKLNYCDDEIHMIGSLHFIDIIRWPDTLINPGSMGFYNYLLFMECYSQVCCLDGEIVGKLLINNQEIDFSGGKVYIEKNWGKSFPLSYIWVQGNFFPQKNIALTLSIGKIPMKLFSFTGFLAAFKLDKKIYKFTSINHSKIDVKIIRNNIIVKLEKDDKMLVVETRCNDCDFVNVNGPKKGKLNVEVKESITSEVKVELIDLYKETMLFQGVSKNSGIEWMGNLEDLRKVK